MKDDSEIPDLLPRSRALPEAPRPAQQGPARSARLAPPPAAAQPAPVPTAPDPDDLEFDLARERGDELPWDSPLRASEPPPSMQLPSTDSVAQGPGSPPASRATPGTIVLPSVRPSASMQPVPPALDLGFDSTAWDLEDELGDPRAAQLNVAVPMKHEDDLPWPTGRTPQAEDLNIAPAEIERTLGVPPVAGWLQSPLYFWVTRRALARLRREVDQAEQLLTQAESDRDAVLAALGQSARSKLEGTDRFRASYERIDQHARALEEARQAFGRADAQGESGLAQVDVELETVRATVTLRTRDTAERRALERGGQHDLARLRAAHQRHVIERRNIVARAQEVSAPGAEMPPELAGRFLAIEEQIKRSEADLQTAQDGYKQIEAQLRSAEEEERRALAHVRRIEGKREGLVLAQEGTLGELSEALRTAEQGLSQAHRDVGLAIVELRGEIPVDEAVRRQLLGFDAAVLGRAIDLERLRRAAESVDRSVYERGRMLLAVVVVSVLVGIGWLAVS